MGHGCPDVTNCLTGSGPAGAGVSPSAWTRLETLAAREVATPSTEPATKTNIPSYFTSAALAAIPEGSVVLAYPYPDLAAGLYFQHSHDIMIDQAVSNMHFKLIGGYG
jgi:hypothetical protein